MSYSAVYFKLVRYLVPVLNSVLGVLLGYHLSTAILAYVRPLPPLATASVSVTLSSAAHVQAGIPAIDVQRIIAAQLFGQVPAQQAPVQAAPPPQEAPETKLNVKLQGILHSDDQHTARALIRLADGASIIVCVGAPLRAHDATTSHCTAAAPVAPQGDPDTPVVAAIYADKVLILRSGRHETLPLAGAEPGQQRQLMQYTPAPASPPVMSADNSQKLAEYRQQILQNPGNLAQYVRMQPAKKDGQFVGYVLHPGREAGLLETFGLQAGDVVTAVNGIVLDSPFKMEALQQLTQASSVNLQILRNGSTMSMNLSVTP